MKPTTLHSILVAGAVSRERYERNATVHSAPIVTHDLPAATWDRRRSRNGRISVRDTEGSSWARIGPRPKAQPDAQSSHLPTQPPLRRTRRRAISDGPATVN